MSTTSSFLQNMQPQQSLVNSGNFINSDAYNFGKYNNTQLPNSSMVGGGFGYQSYNDPTSSLYTGVKPDSAFNLDDVLNYGKAGVDIGTGLMGMYGQYQANQRGKEAMNIARANHQLNVDAANQYKQFRADTKSAFA